MATSLDAAEQEIESLRAEVLEKQALVERLTKRCMAKDTEFDQERACWRRERKQLNAEIVTLRKSTHAHQHPHHR